MFKILKNYISIFFFVIFSGCNTITGTVEGTARGIYKDIKTTHHYTTCVFTKTQCGDLDLDK